MEQSCKIKKDSLYDYEFGTAGMNSVMRIISESKGYRKLKDHHLVLRSPAS
jgi:hypothetical protein